MPACFSISRAAGRSATACVAFAAFLLAATAGCGGRATAGVAAGAADAVTAAPLAVERGRLMPRLVLSGELVAEVAAQATAPNVGVWPLQVRWVAEDGAAVAAGEPVVELDNSELAGELEELRTRRVEAASQVTTAAAGAAAKEATDRLDVERRRAALAKAEIDAGLPPELQSDKQRAERQRDLRRAELDLAAAEVRLAAGRKSAAAELAVAELALRQAEARLASTEQYLERLVLRAPRAGILVLGEAMDAPRALQAGDPVYPGTAVARIPELPSLMVEARLFDVDDGSLAAGLPVTATLDAYPDRTYSGTVRGFDAMAQPTAADSPRRAFRVLVDLESLDLDRMRPGMSVKLDVALPPLDDVVSVPREALVWTDGEPTVLLAGGDRRAVRLGTCTTARCVLLDGPPPGTRLAAARAVADGGSAG